LLLNILDPQENQLLKLRVNAEEYIMNIYELTMYLYNHW